jgi:hypothetical protein
VPTKGRIKRVFPGGNSSRGFFSFYDYIIGSEATRIFIIKGGPGVGKSSFMKTIGDEMISRGYDVEYHHCSSDNNSLDGIVISDLKIALIDGTAPHIVDPKNPGCVDEIINLGDYWDEDSIVRNKEEILKLNRHVGYCFARAYRYLAAAGRVYEDWEANCGYALNVGVANTKKELAQRFAFEGIPVSSITGKTRHLFASAITPEGPKNFLETIFSGAEKMITITGSPGSGKSTLLKKLVSDAEEKGLFTECFHCAFIPEKIEHIWWPQLKLGVTTSIWPHTYSGNCQHSIELDMDEALDTGVLEEFQEQIGDAHRFYLTLFNLGMTAIRQAKAAHDQMEEYYFPHMDFEAIGCLRNKILERIIDFAKDQAVVQV